jgi:hypothetical protein
VACCSRSGSPTHVLFARLFHRLSLGVLLVTWSLESFVGWHSPQRARGRCSPAEERSGSRELAALRTGLRIGRVAGMSVPCREEAPQAVVAERSKAGDSSSLHLLMAWVRTPPTVGFYSPRVIVPSSQTSRHMPHERPLPVDYCASTQKPRPAGASFCLLCPVPALPTTRGSTSSGNNRLCR